MNETENDIIYKSKNENSSILESHFYNLDSSDGDTTKLFGESENK